MGDQDVYDIDAAAGRREKCPTGIAGLDQAIEGGIGVVPITALGLDLESHVNAGRLHFHASRPTLHGLEMHRVHAHAMLMRLVEPLKSRGTTTLMMTLTPGRLSLRPILSRPKVINVRRKRSR